MDILLKLVCDTAKLIEKNVNILHNLKKSYVAITQSLLPIYNVTMAISLVLTLNSKKVRSIFASCLAI